MREIGENSVGSTLREFIDAPLRVSGRQFRACLSHMQNVDFSIALALDVRSGNMVRCVVADAVAVVLLACSYRPERYSLRVEAKQICITH